MGNKKHKRTKLGVRKLRELKVSALTAYRRNRQGANQGTSKDKDESSPIPDLENVVVLSEQNRDHETRSSPIPVVENVVVLSKQNGDYETRSSPILDVENIVLLSERNGDHEIRSLDTSHHIFNQPEAEQTRKRKKKIANFKMVEEDAASECSGERRIVDLDYFLKSLKRISNHSPFDCGISSLELIGEKRIGLESKLSFKCKMCNTTVVTSTCDPSPTNTLGINVAAVSGISSTGIGYSQFSELFTAMNIPTMSQQIFDKTNNTVSKEWERSATLTMEAAAEREREAALKEGRLKNGTPVIDVIVDGFWSQRSYKTKYSALSGGAAIIGRKFGGVLYLGIKNKYCCVCARADNRGILPKNHTCYKNYKGSSTGMEAEIILEGFKSSVDMYDIIYGRMIADGDCNTHKKIIESRPYLNYTVEKIECRNHLLRNMCTKLMALKKDTKYSTVLRKMISTQRILAVRKAICLAIQENKKDTGTLSERINKLYIDISNSYNHAFGQHEHCKEYYCQSEKKSENLVPRLRISAIWNKVQLIIGIVASNARSLINDIDSNRVETFNSVVAKFVGGKRVNYSLRQGYQSRCSAAVVSFNTKRHLHSLQKNILGHSPKSAILKRFENRRIKKNAMKYTPRKLNFTEKPKTTLNDKNYGENCEQPDLDTNQLSQLMDTFLTNLIKTEEERKTIERATVLQRDSSEWLELRRNLITASNFGTIINKKKSTGSSIVKSLLYKRNILNVPSIRHGVENETLALNQMSKQLGVEIQPCGLFIDGELPYLGASPDGLIENDKIVEIKCPISLYSSQLSVEEAVRNKKLPFYKLVDDKIIINKKHSWYYQVQGQLHITKRRYCLFGIWSGENRDLKIESIEKDDVFWENFMNQKLRDFYMGYVLPELVDPRHTRNMPLRVSVNIAAVQKRKSSPIKNIITKKRRSASPENYNTTENIITFEDF